jgi:hypothetical protein
MIPDFSQNRLEPNEPVKRLVARFASDLVEMAGSRGLVALAVVGSAARGEETWRDGKLVGDIDLMAVLRAPDPLTRRRFECASRALGIDVGCFPVYTLRNYRTLEFYEARMSGWVAWGQQDVFKLVRMHASQDIPDWEALRLLLNRAADCVKARAGLFPSWYGAAKAYLALAQADLVLMKQYSPTYLGRWKQVEANRAVLGSAELLEHVRWATRAKLGEETPIAPVALAEYEAWLIRGITQLIQRYLGLDVGLYPGLDMIDRQNKHWFHRLIFLREHLQQPGSWVRILRQDPVFAIWKSLLQIMEGKLILPESKLRNLLEDFDRTLQPLLH